MGLITPYTLALAMQKKFAEFGTLAINSGASNTTIVSPRDLGLAIQKAAAQFGIEGITPNPNSLATVGIDHTNLDIVLEKARAILEENSTGKLPNYGTGEVLTNFVLNTYNIGSNTKIDISPYTGTIMLRHIGQLTAPAIWQRSTNDGDSFNTVLQITDASNSINYQGPGIFTKEGRYMALMGRQSTTTTNDHALLAISDDDGLTMSYINITQKLDNPATEYRICRAECSMTETNDGVLLLPYQTNIAYFIPKGTPATQDGFKMIRRTSPPNSNTGSTNAFSCCGQYFSDMNAVACLGYGDSYQRSAIHRTRDAANSWDTGLSTLNSPRLTAWLGSVNPGGFASDGKSEGLLAIGNIYGLSLALVNNCFEEYELLTIPPSFLQYNTSVNPQKDLNVRGAIIYSRSIGTYLIGNLYGEIWGTQDRTNLFLVVSGLTKKRSGGNSTNSSLAINPKTKSIFVMELNGESLMRWKATS